MSPSHGSFDSEWCWYECEPYILKLSGLKYFCSVRYGFHLTEQALNFGKILMQYVVAFEFVCFFPYDCIWYTLC